MGEMRSLCREERKELRILADEFLLLGRQDVQKIIMSCRNYKEGQQAILRVYDKVYMS